MSRYILDTDAFLLYLMAEEKGVIRQLLHRAEAGEVTILMCSASLADVLVRLSQRFPAPQVERIMRSVHALPITQLSISDTLVYAAAHLRAQYGMDAAQGIAAAAALQEGATLITRTTPVLRPKGLTVQALTGDHAVLRQMAVSLP